MTEPQPAETLLHTKLMIPRRHATLIARGELWARLDGGLSHKLTLVTAPTGFGKTTLVSQWLAERGIPAAWVTLDENDNDYYQGRRRRYCPGPGGRHGDC